MTAPISPSRPRADRYPWVAMGVVLVGTFMVILDTTILNVALPEIGAELGHPDEVEWVVTVYLLAVGIVVPASAWLSDRFGTKLVFAASLGAFTLGSLLAAMAPNLQTLVVFRLVQGLGGGSMMPVGMVMIYRLFPPHRRGTALGIWGIAAMAAPAIGPVAGGWIATAGTWRWLFALNVPIGVLGVLAAYRLLRDDGVRVRRRFDRRGLVLAATGVALLLLAFDRAGTWGWSSAGFLSLLSLAIVLLWRFVRHELVDPDPLIDLSIFREPVFNLTMVIVWLVTIAQFARLVFIPLELGAVRGLTPLQIGLVLTPAALATAVTMPLGGRLTDRVSARLPVATGTGLIAIAAWLLAHLEPTTSPSLIAVYLCVQGLGSGLSVMPNTVTAMNVVPHRLVAQASAIRALSRQLAGSFGVAVLASVVAVQAGGLGGGDVASDVALQEAYNSVFVVAFVLSIIALGLALRLPDRARTVALQAERAAEEAALAV